MPDATDTLTIEHVQAAVDTLAANEVPIDAVKCIETLSCGHTVCISIDQPPYIIDGDKMEIIQPCCQNALNAKERYVDPPKANAKMPTPNPNLTIKQEKFC